MKKLLLIMIIMCGCFVKVEAGQKYNAFENRWETVPNDWDVKYNAFEDEWSYQPKDSQVEYNAFEDSWDWDSGHNNNSKKSKKDISANYFN